MANYNVEESIGGKWAKNSELSQMKRAKIVNEVKPSVSRFLNEDGTPKMQDVAKVKFEGMNDVLNVNLNKATLNGLVKAFGSDSKNWMDKILSVETEKVRVGGKAGVALYLIPEGFQKVDDENGYAKIMKNMDGVQPAPAEEIPTINLDDEEEIKIEEIPF